MSNRTFSVSFDIVTQESAEHGDTADAGYIERRASLRDAVKALHSTRTNMVDGVQAIECDSSPAVRPRWVTVINGIEYQTGAYESRSLHIPASVSAASARRIARLCGATLR